MSNAKKVNPYGVNMKPIKERCPSTKPFQCNLCDNSYVSKYSLKSHQTIVHNVGKSTKNICVFCKKRFNCSTNLETHLRLHNKERPYFCKICTYESSRLEYIKVHLKTHLSEYKRLTETQKKLFSEFKLNQHLQNPKENPYKCKICEKGFSLLQNLKRHEKTHSDIQSFECNVCEYKSKTRGCLKQHKQIHAKQSPYDCQICQKRFNYQHALVDHMRIHTGEKPYNCKICKKDFTRQGDLKNHEIIHSEELLFSCRICFKRFRQRRSLSIHLRIHSGEKPYKCEVCKNHFRQNSHLKRHLQLHKNKN